MAIWEDVVYSASELISAAGRKVNDVTSITKQKFKLAENERAIGGALEALGHLVYENRRNGVDLDESLVKELLDQVDSLMEANKNIQAELDMYYERETCSCGAVNPHGAAYCNSCGKAL